MSKFSQIQTYVKNRRNAIGNKYDPDTTRDNFFSFGVELGNGSEESHFHLGFTEIKLLERLNQFKN